MVNNNFTYIPIGVELIIPASIEIPEGEVRDLCVEISNRNVYLQRNVELYISVTHSKSLHFSYNCGLVAEKVPNK